MSEYPQELPPAAETYEIDSSRMVLMVNGKLRVPQSTWKYEPPLFRNTDSETSKQAAEKAKAFKGIHIAKILECLRAHGAMIPAEIARRTGLDYHAVQRRQSEMRETGLIERTGVVIHGQHELRAK